MVDASDGFPVLQSSPVSLPVDSTPIIAQPIAEQVSETTFEVKSSVLRFLAPFLLEWHDFIFCWYFQIPVSTAAPPVLDVSPVLTQPVIEQVADAAPTAVEVLQAAATTEQSLTELGLAGYTPVGLIQHLLEFMHVDLGLPWWGAIVIGKQSQKIVFHFVPTVECLSFTA